MTTILYTVHGSRLSGLARPDSDYDYYTVVDHGKSHQKIFGQTDNLTVVIDDFLRLVAEGEPQALTALWSPLAEIDPNWAPLLCGLHPDTVSATRKFAGAITAFSAGIHRSVERYDDLEIKARQHMIRLSLLLGDLLAEGRYNPQLSQDRISLIQSAARLSEDGFMARLTSLCPVPVKTLWPTTNYHTASDACFVDRC